MKHEIMKNCHLSHKGVNGTLSLARDYVYWPEMRRDIITYVNNCKICQKIQKDKPMEKILKQEVPKRPWSIVASDLFQVKDHHYLLIADAYSGYFDFIKLNMITSSEVIDKIKYWFAQHGIPDVFLTDNGRQYSSGEFKEFSNKWQFQHRFSSPEFPRSNGLAERYVQEAKTLIKKCYEDHSVLNLALLHHRNKPRGSLGSPAQRLMGRRTQNLVTTNKKLLQPETIKNVRNKLKQLKLQQKLQADKNKIPEQQFDIDEKILFRHKKNEWIPARVLNTTSEPRSYLLQTEQENIYRRNSWFLRHMKEREKEVEEEEQIEGNEKEGVEEEEQRKENEIEETNINPSQQRFQEIKEETTSRYGRKINKPLKLNL